MVGHGQSRRYPIHILRKSMVLILNDNSEVGAHARSNPCYLICLRHLMRSISVKNRGFFLSEKTLYLFCVCVRHSELPSNISSILFTCKELFTTISWNCQTGYLREKFEQLNDVTILRTKYGPGSRFIQIFSPSYNEQVAVRMWKATLCLVSNAFNIPSRHPQGRSQPTWWAPQRWWVSRSGRRNAPSQTLW